MNVKKNLEKAGNPASADRAEKKAIHWEVGEKIPVEQSITIHKATASLQDTIGHLTEVI